MHKPPRTPSKQKKNKPLPGGYVGYITVGSRVHSECPLPPHPGRDFCTLTSLGTYDSNVCNYKL